MSNYEQRMNKKVHETVEDAALDETKNYLLNIRKQTNKDAAITLNNVITSYKDKHTQLRCLQFILMSIKEFQPCNV